ncbi:MAG: ER membrane protein DP1/Yop1 [Caeruleum heppii]|nr:MAG: ER membrane protein DP1/Yop1 [Caeruleum heppii]
MSIQDRANHQISQFDKEVRLASTPSIAMLQPACYAPLRSSVEIPKQRQIGLTLRQLSKYPALNNFEKQTSVPKVYVALGLVGVYFSLVFFNIGGQFLVNTAGFAIPSYYSLNALFSASKVDDTQWLTYWVIYAFMTVIESAINAVYWFPFYYTFKFIFLLWLSLPQFGGAQVIFRSFLQPVFARHFASSVGSTASNLRSKADEATMQ